jgi:hypothetical protein
MQACNKSGAYARTRHFAKQRHLDGLLRDLTEADARNVCTGRQLGTHASAFKVYFRCRLSFLEALNGIIFFSLSPYKSLCIVQALRAHTTPVSSPSPSR